MAEIQGVRRAVEKCVKFTILGASRSNFEVYGFASAAIGLREERRHPNLARKRIEVHLNHYDD